MNKILHFLARLDSVAPTAIRIGLAIVFIWIGSLKFADYEAEGIVPFVANSPFMSFFYEHPEQYADHLGQEGAYDEQNHAWHVANNTYGFSYGLGIFLIAAAILVLSHRIVPLWSAIGSALIVLMTLGTLSFLITTPEAWIADAGARDSGFPFLSGRGRLVVKDAVILGAALFSMSQSARLYLYRISNSNSK